MRAFAVCVCACVRVQSYGGLYTPNLGVLLNADPHINFKVAPAPHVAISYHSYTPFALDYLY